MGHSSNLSYVKQKGVREREDHFFSFVLAVREEKREKGRDSNFSLRSMEIGWSEFVRPRTEVHLLDEGYA